MCSNGPTCLYYHSANLSGLTVPMSHEDPRATYDGFVDVGGEAVVDVAIGYNAVYAVTHTGRLAAWGESLNPDSLLGTRLSRETTKPVFVTERCAARTGSCSLLRASPRCPSRRCRRMSVARAWW
jgi:hypothetical protein